MTMTAQDRKWIEELVIALRLRDVRGDAIADAVAAVESHCAESGETPHEAFGDPHDYAASLDFPDDLLITATARDWLGLLGPVVAGLMGLTAATATVRAVRLGQEVEISVGQLASFAFLAVFVLLTVRVLAALLRHMVAGSLFLGAGLVGATALAVALQQTAFSADPLVMGLVAALLLALSVVGNRRLAGRPTDPVRDPRDGRDRYSRSDTADGRGSAAAQAFAAASGWVYVLAAVALGALTWFTAG